MTVRAAALVVAVTCAAAGASCPAAAGSAVAAVPARAPGAAAGMAGGASPACTRGRATTAAAGRPTVQLAWRAGLRRRTPVYARATARAAHPLRWVTPAQDPWLLVLGARPVAGGGCELRVRLPWRPNGAAGWVNAAAVTLRSTPWRIAVSLARRTVTLLDQGRPVSRSRAVIGKPSTPTPTGLFAVAQAVPWHPNAFLGSWVLALTAHSDVLRTFDGGNGTVAIHGRGGLSLLNPLGSASSHGCVRLANAAIDALVRRIGRRRLVGTPVQIT